MGSSDLSTAGRARSKAAAAAASFALTTAVVLAACGGGSKSSAGNVSASPGANSGGSGNLAGFCTDYVHGVYELQQSGGDVTDLSFFQFQTSMEKAQREAPSAVRSDVSAIVNTANKAQDTSYNGNVTKYVQRINAWAKSNCPTATSTTAASATTDTTDPNSCVTDATGSCATTDSSAP